MKIAKRLNDILPSKTLSITNRVLELRQQGVEVIGLGAGEPDFGTPDHIKQAGIEAIQKGYTRYTNSTGIPELKEAIVEKLKRDNGIDYNTAEIIVSCGGKHALATAILAVCDEGDEALIPSPYWVSYPEMVHLASAKPVFVPMKVTDQFCMDIDALEKATTSKTRVLFFNNPVNPTGAVYDVKMIDALVDWLKTKDILVITDEIYESLIFDDIKIRSLASYPEIKDRVITVNGVSKAYAMTGWRIGYAAGPKPLISQMAKIQSHMTSNPCSISQWASVAALSGDQSFIDKMVSAFRERRDYVLQRLSEIEGINCPKSQGAFYLFPQVSSFLGRSYSRTRIEDVVGLCQYLLEEKKVALVPGDAFGSSEHVRISYATSIDQLEKAMDRIQDGLRNLD